MPPLRPLAKPSSITSTTRLVVASQQGSASRPEQRKAPTGSKRSFSQGLTSWSNNEARHQAIESTFLGWLGEASRTRSHDHGATCTQLQRARHHTRTPGASIRGIRWKDRRSITTAARLASSASAGAVALFEEQEDSWIDDTDAANAQWQARLDSVDTTGSRRISVAQISTTNARGAGGLQSTSEDVIPPSRVESFGQDATVELPCESGHAEAKIALSTPWQLDEQTKTPKTLNLSNPDVQHNLYQLEDQDIVSLPAEKLEALVPDTSYKVADETIEAQTPYERPRQRMSYEQFARMFPLAPRLMSNDDITKKRQPWLPANDQEAQAIDKMKALLASESGLSSPAEIWSAFEALPEPQVQYLAVSQINRMFKHLARVEYYRHPNARDNVITLYRQCLHQRIPLKRSSWTISMLFAGRGDRTVTSQRLEQAVEIWTQMERCGVEPDEVTFNALYHMAVKARRFSLADTFLTEIKARKLPVNRYMRCSMIHCAGLRGDAVAVRSHFADFIHAGEIVDTAVMNCVVTALVYAGDGIGAESTFDNMKTLHQDKFLSKPIAVWQERHRFAKVANAVSQAIRDQEHLRKTSFFSSATVDRDRLEALQLLSPVGPDATTYRVMIGYHALVTGDLARVRELLAEMTASGHAQHGSIFQRLFHAFHLHGGKQDTPWTAAALENLWADFIALLPGLSEGQPDRKGFDQDDSASDFLLAAAADYPDAVGKVDINPAEALLFSQLSELDKPPYFSVTMVKSILRAFWICCGHQRMGQAWAEIQTRWHDMNKREKLAILQFVHDLTGPEGLRLIRPE